MMPETNQHEAGSGCPGATCSAIDGVKISHEHGHLCFRSGKGWLLWSTKLEEMSESGESLEVIINDFSQQNTENRREAKQSQPTKENQ